MLKFLILAPKFQLFFSCAPPRIFHVFITSSRIYHAPNAEKRPAKSELVAELHVVAAPVLVPEHRASIRVSIDRVFFVQGLLFFSCTTLHFLHLK